MKNLFKLLFQPKNKIQSKSKLRNVILFLSILIANSTYADVTFINNGKHDMIVMYRFCDDKSTSPNKRICSSEIEIVIKADEKHFITITPPDEYNLIEVGSARESNSGKIISRGSYNVYGPSLMSECGTRLFLKNDEGETYKLDAFFILSDFNGTPIITCQTGHYGATPM